MCHWLDQWTHYRSWREIAPAYKRYFKSLENIEADYMAQRLGTVHPMAKLPRAWRRLLINKLAGRVFVAHAG